MPKDGGVGWEMRWQQTRSGSALGGECAPIAGTTQPCYGTATVRMVLAAWSWWRADWHSWQHNSHDTMHRRTGFHRFLLPSGLLPSLPHPSDLSPPSFPLCPNKILLPDFTMQWSPTLFHQSLLGTEKDLCAWSSAGLAVPVSHGCLLPRGCSTGQVGWAQSSHQATVVGFASFPGLSPSLLCDFSHEMSLPCQQDRKLLYYYAELPPCLDMRNGNENDCFVACRRQSAKKRSVNSLHNWCGY